MKILALLILLLTAHLAKAKLRNEFTVEGYITKISQEDVTISMHGNDITVAKKYISRENLRPGKYVSVKVPKS